MSFFKKLKDRLFRSSDKISDGLDALVADACEAAAVNSDKDAADKAVADLYAMRAAAGI